MYRLAALATALMMAAACGSNNNTPTQPSGNTGPIVFTAQLSAANEVPPFVLLAEGWGIEQDFITDMRIALSADRCANLDIEPGYAMDFYRHQLTILSN